MTAFVRLLNSILVSIYTSWQPREKNNAISVGTLVKRLKLLFFLLALLQVCLRTSAQDRSKVKFGEVSPSDFNLPASNIIDSNANAVIIEDVGSTTFIGNKKGWFTLVFKRQTRIKILNEKAFGLAVVRISLYMKDDDEEKLVDLKASTYNLQSGQVISSKLEKNDLFKDKVDKNHVEERFTMPAVKSGSIIEYSYTINSDFLFNMPSWNFQHVSYPCLWSDYEAIVPNLLLYTIASQGIHQYYVNESKMGHQTYSVKTSGSGNTFDEGSQNLVVDAATNIHRFVMKDIPAFKIEDYLTSPENYIDKVEFQSSKVSSDGESYTDVMNSWEKTSEELLKRDDFGILLHDDDISIASKEIDFLTNNINDKLEVAEIIYNYVKHNFTCIDDEGFLMTNSIRELMKKKSGNVADINLLLLAFLNHKGIFSEPVLLSTKDHGFNLFKYPILSKYNYILCKADINNKTYFLDATNPVLGFGKLDSKCYNGEARVINYSAPVLIFSSDSLKESKLTSVLISTNDHGEIVGSFQQEVGYFSSCKIREKVIEKGKDEFFKDIKSAYDQDVDITNPRIDSLHNLEQNVTIAYDIKFGDKKADFIYINPMLDQSHRENPFKSAERFYPVEMPYTTDETYIFTMFVPDGYTVDELPQSVIFKLNQAGDGRFEYRIEQSGGTISMRSRIQLKRTYFDSAEYDTLREFFNMIVKKQSEQIVLKKKK